MVSRNNIILIGLAVLLLGVGAFSFRPKGGVILPKDTVQAPQLPNNQPQINFLRDQIKAAKQLLSNFSTRGAPNLGTSVDPTGRRIGFKFAGPIQAKGVISAIDPVSGIQVPIGFTERASRKTKLFFGGDVDVTRRFVEQGTMVKSDIQSFIADLRSQIGLLQSKTV